MVPSSPRGDGPVALLVAKYLPQSASMQTLGGAEFFVRLILPGGHPSTQRPCGELGLVSALCLVNPRL